MVDSGQGRVSTRSRARDWLIVVENAYERLKMRPKLRKCVQSSKKHVQASKKCAVARGHVVGVQGCVAETDSVSSGFGTRENGQE
jgi:hypothetical protein